MIGTAEADSSLTAPTVLTMDEHASAESATIESGDISPGRDAVYHSALLVMPFIFHQCTLRHALTKLRLHQAVMNRVEAFLSAAARGWVRDVRSTLAAGMPVDAANVHGTHALHMSATFVPSPEVAEVLLDAGATVDHLSEEGRTPLMFAAGSAMEIGDGRRRALLSLLLRHGASARRRATGGVWGGMSALDIATARRDEDKPPLNERVAVEHTKVLALLRWSRVRGLASLVGRLALFVRALFEEVTLRPGHQGYLAAMGSFHDATAVAGSRRAGSATLLPSQSDGIFLA